MAEQFTEQNGGPAFPISLPGHGDNGHGGMTLRDWFAGQCVGPLVAEAPTLSNDICGKMAAAAYRIADAMLAERSK